MCLCVCVLQLGNLLCCATFWVMLCFALNLLLSDWRKNSSSIIVPEFFSVDLPPLMLQYSSLRRWARSSIFSYFDRLAYQWGNTAALRDCHVAQCIQVTFNCLQGKVGYEPNETFSFLFADSGPYRAVPEIGHWAEEFGGLSLVVGDCRGHFSSSSRCPAAPVRVCSCYCGKKTTFHWKYAEVLCMIIIRS